MLRNMGYEVTSIPVTRRIRRSTVEEIRLMSPRVVVATSFVLAPTLVRLRRRIDSFYWLDMMDSATETRRIINAGVIRNLYFQLIEKPAIKNLLLVANIITYISEKDYEMDEKLHSSVETKPAMFIIPNKIEQEISKYRWSGLKRLVIVGDFSYKHNKRMLKIASKIASKIDLPLHIYGHGTRLIKLFRPNKLVHGYVHSNHEFNQIGDLHVAPVAQIAGIKNKISNALINGMPVLTTKEGIQGINLSSGAFLFSISKLDQINRSNIEQSLLKIKGQEIWKGFTVNEEKKLELFFRTHLSSE